MAGLHCGNIAAGPGAVPRRATASQGLLAKKKTRMLAGLEEEEREEDRFFDFVYL